MKSVPPRGSDWVSDSLVRLSCFDATKLVRTCFALANCLPRGGLASDTEIAVTKHLTSYN